ncbi:hypothetical protein B0H15DRAFT_794587 [Mycena belliarum]|uniref:HMG domain-containing protein n=1 Tax=Mycena belliarum TaxID=1033014 RepID=A0AAD6TQ24_9AGAR|nr:hypothetical protein B0H15DRAFT_794587 [Mycena belliae]
MSSPIWGPIRLKTPPASPGPSRITLASDEDDTYGPIISPIKHSRTVRDITLRPTGSNNRRKRAKKKNVVPSTELGEAQLQIGLDSVLPHDPIIHESEAMNMDVEEQPRELDTAGITQDHLDKGYQEYISAVMEDGTGFFQIAQNMFVVNGWDVKTKRSKDTWYHIQRSTIGSERVFVCTCPASHPDASCVHGHFLQEHGLELFPVDPDLSDIDQDIVLFSRQIGLDDQGFLNYFSCPSPIKRGLAGRTVVTYEGEDDANGRWKCEKDIGNCSHIGSCRKKLLQLVQGDPDAKDSGVVEDFYENPAKASGSEKSVSYKQRPPPIWASLPGDPVSAPIPPRFGPQHLALDDESSCSCREEACLRFRPQDTGAIRTSPCTVYGLFEPSKITIELQTCICKYRLIGPDCISHGLFNYNNKLLFTHEILDEYTAAYTSSETPFSAWNLVVSRRYNLQNASFCSAETFRSAWFAYTKLQYLEGDMLCPKCGPCPENTIWDGVTLAFNRKHLLPSLEPPTISQPSSIVRHATSYVPKQQLLPDSPARKAVQKVINGPPLIMQLEHQTDPDEDEEDDEDDDEDAMESARTRSLRKRNRELLERLNAIPVAIAQLAAKNPALSRLFDQHFGNNAVVNGVVPPGVYKRFFLQISAEESVLQMANLDGLNALQDFLKNPSRLNASALVNIPVLHELLEYEFRQHGLLSADVLEVCHWITDRGDFILGWLKEHSTPPLQLTATNCIEKPWTDTGCCYGMPKIRERPIYPKLKHDTRPDPGGKRGAKCSKFYSQYGEKKLTGGIMCVWCTHSVCYGFHCIPRGEGRNDVFSALVTRWKKAPKCQGSPRSGPRSGSGSGSGLRSDPRSCLRSDLSPRSAPRFPLRSCAPAPATPPELRFQIPRGL